MAIVSLFVLEPTSSAEQDERKLVRAVCRSLAWHDVDAHSCARADVTAEASAEVVAVGPNAAVALLIDDRHDDSVESVFRLVRKEEQPSEMPDGTSGLCVFLI